MTLRLQPFNFTLHYTTGENNIADFTSCHPSIDPKPDNYEIDEYLNPVAKFATPKALSLEDIRKATKEDKILQEVIRLTRFNPWYELEKIIPKGFTKDEFCLLKQFRNIKDNITRPRRHTEKQPHNSTR